MKILFKAIGLAVLFFSSCFFGFCEAEKLKDRVKRLAFFVRAASEYAGRVRVGTEEVDRLLLLCFGERYIRRRENGFSVLPCFTGKEDAALAEEFFRDVGMGDAQSEYERTNLYITLFSKRLEEAEKDVRERCRLFRALGVLGGCFLCIFLL